MKKCLFTLYLLLVFYFVSAQVADKVTVIDTESTTNPAPSSFSKEVRFHFKWNASIGVPHIGSPGPGTYSGLMTIAPWSDGTGPRHHQINFNEDGLFWRKGAFGSSWEGWRRIVTEDENGNVGIGAYTSGSPARLFISSNSNSTSDNTLRLQAPNIGTNASHIHWGQTGDWYIRSANSSGKVVIQDTGGNVSIGTVDSKGYKLAVAGKAIAEEIVVKLQGSWPDYVFEDAYQLPSLSETEKYIKTNKHLPEVPSASEIKENGLSLGEMNAILLKKVEELTLHLIRQDKRLDEQQNQIARQQEEIERIR